MLLPTTLILLLAPLLTFTAPTPADPDLIHLDDLPPINHHHPVLAVQVHQILPYTSFGSSPRVVVSLKNGYNAIHTLLKYDLSEYTDVNSKNTDVDSTSFTATGKDLPPNNTKHEYLCKLEFLIPPKRVKDADNKDDISDIDAETVEGKIPTIMVSLLEKAFNKNVKFKGRPEIDRVLAVVDVENGIVDHIGDGEDPGYSGWPCDPKGSYYLEVSPVINYGVYDTLDLDVRWVLGSYLGLAVYVEERTEEGIYVPLR